MKIILIGDSITQGLGSKKINFTLELEHLMGDKCEILNYALTGSTIKYGIELMPKIKAETPDLLINLYGNVDAQIRPSRSGKIFKNLPKRFQLNNGSMLSPRPFYSANIIKRAIQKIENLFRTVFRKMIYQIDGYEQWVHIDEYINAYDSLCKELYILGVRTINCSTVYIDGKLFPHSDDEYIKYNKEMNRISQKYNFKFIDLYTLFKCHVEQKGWNFVYNADHFHPNGQGYVFMAECISNYIKKEFE